MTITSSTISHNTAAADYGGLSQDAFSSGIHLLAAVNAGGSTVDSLGETFGTDTSGSPSSYLDGNSSASAPTTPCTGAISASTAANGVSVGTNLDIFKTARVVSGTGSYMVWSFGGAVKDTFT